MRTVNAIAAGIAQEIRAGTRELGVRQRATSDKRYALRSYLRSRLRQRVAPGVDVTQENPAGIAFEIGVHGIAARDAIRDGECVGAGILHTQRVSADQGSRGNPTIHLENAAQLSFRPKALKSMARPGPESDPNSEK